MTITTINNVIAEICKEIDHDYTMSCSWINLSEKKLLYEILVCISGSQMKYEMSLSLADQIISVLPADLLEIKDIEIHQLEEAIKNKLSKGILICSKNGTTKISKPRFKNRLTKLVCNTLHTLYGNGLTIKNLIHEANNPYDLRKVLVEKISGFGPKQASLFLRRIAYPNDFAVLDTHIIDYLSMAEGQDINIKALSNLKNYEEIEGRYRQQVSKFEKNIGCIDLATWITMRVAKQETYI